jgi:hypothetical protein
MEVQLAGATWPAEVLLKQIAAARAVTGVSVALAPLVPKERVPGKQLMRTRIGYRVAELPELDRRLSASGTRLDRVLCRIDPGASPWSAVLEYLALPPLQHVGVADWLVTLPAQREGPHTARAAEALFAAALLTGTRVYLEPLVDLDRTMDVNDGLLDRRCNPRPAFHTVRCLNTILYSHCDAASAGTAHPAAAQTDQAPAVAGGRALALTRAGNVYRLFSPSDATDGAVELTLEVSPIAGGAAASGAGTMGAPVARYLLASGARESVIP